MPDRGPVLKPERVEAALPKDVRDALPALLAIWGIRDGNWPEQPPLRAVLSLTAVRVVLARYEERGMSRKNALWLACGDLGMSFDAAKKHLERTRKAYLTAHESATKCRPRPLPGARTSGQETQKRQA